VKISAIRTWTVGAKLTAFTFTLVTAIFVAFIFFITHMVSKALEQRAADMVEANAEGVANMMDMFNRSQLTTVEKFSVIYARMWPASFSIDEQKTIDTGGTPLPALQYDGSDVNNNFSTVDRFTDMTGGTATVFIKKGDDFFRVATSVQKADGSRAVGTNLGKAHPAYATLMKGETYRGTAILFGKPYVTEYAPIKDAKGDLLGILYVGIDISSDLAALKTRIKALKVGESGFFFVLDAKKGDSYGTFLSHPTMEGKKGIDLRDVNGREVVKDILETQKGTSRFVLANDPSKRERIAVYYTDKNWNWTIGGIAFADEVAKEISSVRNIAFTVGILALCGFAALLFVIVRRLVSQPLGAARSAAERLAQGDLTVRLTTGQQDEIGQLMNAMNGISGNLTSVVSTIREGTDKVAAASAEIAAGNQDLSGRTERQASSLEETASSMEELTSTVAQNADNARQANQLATSASQVASKGGEVVSQVVSTMNSISESSKKITDIIGVIDGIAFQTNILALNASVEAARAGEQGRGFAVVASEVRSLAQRSANAAKEIKALIGDSAGKVDTGSKLVSEAGDTMNDVVDSVRRVTDIMAEIMAATQEQSSGINEINRAIADMDQNTQQNVALVDAAANAAQSMQEMAEHLTQAVSVFRLDGSTPSAYIGNTAAATALPAKQAMRLK
jgi:methyl-accepting chemotaxis protein-2 (aspartate sensor receptor)